MTIEKTKPDLNETLPLNISQKDSNYNSNSKITNLSRGKNPILLKFDGKCELCQHESTPKILKKH